MAGNGELSVRNVPLTLGPHTFYIHPGLNKHKKYIGNGRFFLFKRVPTLFLLHVLSLTNLPPAKLISSR